MLKRNVQIKNISPRLEIPVVDDFTLNSKENALIEC